MGYSPFCSFSQSVLFATVAPLDGGRVHVISLSMQSLTPTGQDDSGGIIDGDDEGDEFGPNHCVCVTSSSSSSSGRPDPEDATDKLVRRLAMDAVWCTQLRIDPQNDLGVQTFDEKVREISGPSFSHLVTNYLRV